MYIQGGDLTKNGVSKYFIVKINISIEEHASIFEGEFADESFHVKHTEIGLLGMCKKKGF